MMPPPNTSLASDHLQIKDFCPMHHQCVKNRVHKLIPSQSDFGMASCAVLSLHQIKSTAGNEDTLSLGPQGTRDVMTKGEVLSRWPFWGWR